jgi:hypothetical protein
MRASSYFELGFTRNIKVRRLSDAAFRLWMSTIDNANESRTNGRVESIDIDVCVKAPHGKALVRAVAELVGSGLWVENQDGSWDIHNFVKWQGSAEKRDAIRTRARKRKIARYLRQAVIAHHGMICGLCRQPICSLAELHIDHVVPFSRGGDTAFYNLQPAHARCNLRKGATIQ